MGFNLDIAIVLVFLLVNLFVGLSHGMKIKNIKDYALGGRNFSTGVLVATVTATWISGSGFFTTLSKTYSDGLYYTIASSGMALSFIIVAVYFVPRMEEFLGKTSVAEIMGYLYGSRVRFLSAIAGAIGISGSIAVQFKAFGTIFTYFAGVQSDVAVIAAGVIVTLYSSYGGIRAVTYTDVLQFFTFGFVIPLVGVIIWNNVYSTGFSIEEAFSVTRFDYHEVFKLDNPKFWEMVPLFFFFLIPSMSPTLCQRVLMGNNIAQAKKVFIISAILILIVKLIMAWIPFLIYHVNPNLKANQLLVYVVDNYTYVGLKGLIIIGIIAMAMSSADSYINSSSVLIVDICKALKIGMNNKEILLSKISALILGVAGVIFALMGEDLLKIILFTHSFYTPIVVVPLTLAIFGFRSTEKAVLIGMGAAFITVVAWYFLGIKTDSIVFAMLVNTVFFMGSHYLLKQPGGWVGIKGRMYLDNLKIERQNKFKRFVKSVKNFSWSNFCKGIAPSNDLIYMGFGIYCIVYTFTTIYSTQTSLLGYNGRIILWIYQIMLITGVVLAIYPIWPMSIRYNLQQKIAQFLWPIAVFYMLVFFSGFFVMVSSFGQLQFSVFTINMIIAIMLVGWKFASIMMLVGFYSSTQFYKFYSGLETLDFSIGSPQFVFMYTLMLIGTALVIFFKPKQEELALTVAKASHLGERVVDKDVELVKLNAIKNEFLRNLQHEAHTPITGIASMGEVLWDNYDKFNDDQKRLATEEIAKSSRRLRSLVDNMIDLSKLSSLTCQLNKQRINFSDFVHDRFQYCRKIYVGDKTLQFVEHIDNDIELDCDPHYMKSVLDNLVINAIQYSNRGTITISVKDIGDSVEFSIQDEGIGIPKAEIYDIFESFVVSSHTKTPSGGRGIGLAVCKKAINSHGGNIWAESDGQNGAKFIFTVPK